MLFGVVFIVFDGDGHILLSMLSRFTSRCLPALNGCLIQSRVIVRGAYQVPGNDNNYEQVPFPSPCADGIDRNRCDGHAEGAEGPSLADSQGGLRIRLELPADGVAAQELPLPQLRAQACAHPEYLAQHQDEGVYIQGEGSA